MRLNRVLLRVLRMQLKAPFRTSFGSQSDRRFILVEVDFEGISGLGEVGAFSSPLYNEEFTDSALLVLRDYLGPALVGKEIPNPHGVADRLSFVRRHHMAKAGLEGAIWDAFAKSEGIPLWQALGGERRPIPVGVSVGIQESPAALVETVSQFVNQGYRRIKLKIEPGRDLDYVRAVRGAFPDVPMMVDANSAYRLEDVEQLRRLDEFDLMMIEQPLSHDDIVQHAELQKHLRTRICLDESLHTPEDVRLAIRLGACGVVNIKVGRVAGLQRVREIEQICRTEGIPVWCGGMLESGVGRAHNVALATLPGFTLPGDTSGSNRYWHQDIVTPEITVNPDGTIDPPGGPGIGYRPDWQSIERFTEETVQVV